MVRSVINSLMDMEHTKPGSCEFLVTRVLHRLARYVLESFFIFISIFNCTFFPYKNTYFSSKEPSLKDLQEVAIRGFSKGKKVTEPENVNANAESDNQKKQQEKEIKSNANLGPLARFLLSRYLGSRTY